MNKKGSMELSVNSIVILVIAVVMMGLILTFIKVKFSEVNSQVLIDEPSAPAATTSEPVTLSRSSLIVGSGKEIGLKFEVYALRDITSADKPHIICSNGNPTFTIKTNGKTAPAGSIVTYEGLVKVSNSAKGKYICSLTFGATSFDATFIPVGSVEGTQTYSKDLIVDIQ